MSLASAVGATTVTSRAYTLDPEGGRTAEEQQHLAVDASRDRGLGDELRDAGRHYAASVLPLARSFRFAFVGLWHVLRTQRNFRIEATIGVAAVVLAAWLRITPPEWAALAVVIALVLILEGLNTSLEIAVDLASPALDPKAKVAKDVAAGMVLVAALASVAVGIAIFTPHLR